MNIPKRPVNSHRLPLLEGRGLGEPKGKGMTLPIIFGLAGVGSVYMSKAIADQNEDGTSNVNVKMAMKFLGFGAIGYSLYSLVASYSSEADASEGKPSEIPGASEFTTVSGAFLKPSEGAQVPSSAKGFFKDAYDVNLLFSNPSSRPVDLIYQIVATERPTYLFGADANWWTPKVEQVASNVIQVPAKGSLPAALQIKPISELSWLADGISVQLSLQARRTAGDPWKVLSTLNFQYDRAGWL